MPGKKPKYACKYNQAWCTEFSFIQPCTSANQSAFCTYCKSSFTVSAGGRNDITRHAAGDKHKKNASSILKTGNISTFFSVGSESMAQVSIMEIYFGFKLQSDVI